MKYYSKLFAACLILILSNNFLLANYKQSTIDETKNSQTISAAKDVIQRLIGDRAKEFNLISMDKNGDGDYYQYSASDGIITIKGTSAIALTRGFYDYLKSNGFGMVTWSGQRIDLPKELPDCSLVINKTPFQFREYFNVCTFGYTTVWWDWDRWEKELDWMALHGINMPLAMVGQEIIWTRLWESLRISRKELDDFFTGPAFLPWQRMGNVNKHGGPLSDEWMEKQRVLQHKILDRMRELGMTPIAPAFSGFVPPSFEKIYTNEKIIKNSNWGSFSDGYQTYVLTPGSQLFIEIGKAFIKEYEKEYGVFNYYLADTFNELQVPVSVDNRYNELAAFGKAVFTSIDSGNSNATWIMQGWMFGNDQTFWDKASVKALLRDVPNERVMILDLATEMFEGWKKHDGFYGKLWINSVIHNFGGNNPFYGDIKFFAHNWADVLKDSTKGALVGIGLSPEGIENNEVIYELLADAAWNTKAIDLNNWIKSYALSRYGQLPSSIIEAWQLMLEHIYTYSSLNFKHAFQSRPSHNPISSVKDTVALRKIVDLFLSAYDKCKDSQLFINDLIEVSSYYASTVIDKKIVEAIKANDAGELSLRDTLANEAFSLIQLLDNMIAERYDLTLEKWIESAKNWSDVQSQKDLMEKNARTQVTIWGGPDLYDYASKIWSGLISDFYKKRWEIYFDELRKDKESDSINKTIINWEEVWTNQLELKYNKPTICAINTIQDLIFAIDNSIRLTASPEIIVDKAVALKGDSTKVVLKSSDTLAIIYYTLNGDEPTEKNLIYSAPFYIKSSSIIKAKSFRSRYRNSITSSFNITQVDSSNGIICSYFEKTISSLSDPTLKTLNPTREKTVYSFNINDIDPRNDNFIETFETILDIENAGEYNFYTESDDGSRLFVDDSLVVDNDGYHARKEIAGKIWLVNGRHKLNVQFFEASGAESLTVSYSGPGLSKQQIQPIKLFLPNSK